ncbi:MAG: methylmalonyl Co-A mutase-associated GTPase MeaB [Bacteroidia bacterium]|nr:methylmalonyl Co-A mutase-associated GTPase MeaB [Bacteroidia bacterium]
MTLQEASESMLLSIAQGDRKVLARAITVLENDLEGSRELLHSLKISSSTPVVGVTGPPGAGKSTLINAMISEFSASGKKIAVLAVDPTSPFNYGSLLADRLRMSEHFTDPNIFIRSLATRGSLGGLSEKIIEITDLLRAADFDMIIVETVGVGQSEVEIAGLADTTLVVIVPESGDEIQTLKSGIMEIADIFIVNKCDREGADTLVNSLEKMLHDYRSGEWQVPVVKTSATRKEGIKELLLSLESHSKSTAQQEKKVFLLSEKAYRLIQQTKMKGIFKLDLSNAIKQAFSKPDFNLYLFVDQYVMGKIGDS